MVDIYDDPLLNELAERLQDPDPGVRRVAVMDLVDSGEPEAAQLLIVALKDEDEDVRREAAKVVDEFDSAEIADALLEALDDADEVVRNAAAHALADLKDPAAAPPLLAALDRSSDPFVLAGVLRALKPLRVVDSKPRALALLEHRDAGVRREAVAVLGWLRTPDTLPALMGIAASDPDQEVRRAAVGTLVASDGETVADTLFRALEDEHWRVRAEAAVSVGKLGLPRGLDPLIKTTHDEFWQVREKAAEALGKLGSTAAIPALGACSRDPMSNLRKTAIGALGEIGHRDAMPFVEQALHDPDPDVRKLARWAQDRLDRAA